jgi:hypothetical protein
MPILAKEKCFVKNGSHLPYKIMTATLTAVYKRHEDWYIGYVEELSGGNVQEEARENLLGSRAAYHRK